MEKKEKKGKFIYIFQFEGFFIALYLDSGMKYSKESINNIIINATPILIDFIIYYFIKFNNLWR